jgi:hypothetical protein
MCSSSRPLTRAGAATSKDSRGFRGGVRANGVAVRGATVALLRVGSTPAGARVLTTATTDAGGMFDLPVPPDLTVRLQPWPTVASGSEPYPTF